MIFQKHFYGILPRIIGSFEERELVVHRSLTFVMRSALGVILIGTFIVGGNAWFVQGADKDKDAEPDISLGAFMRKKLDSSSQILEGLTIEDPQLILQGAKSLLEMSKAEKWKLVINSEFRSHDVEFRATVRKIVEAAEQNNFDNAALQWFDATKACIECHRDVRTASKTKK